MEKLNSSQIRQKFLKFFKENHHEEIAPSFLVPKNDPTLLFINSGMAPLKNYFLGEETPRHPDLCNFQPCIRTRDIDDVGDRHHLTFFEMLGSWSIGNYYKEKACELAYKLLVHEFGFDPEKLYVTVYEGNKEKGLEPDTASIEAWKKVGVKEDHIVMKGEDNFWGPAGETGPCGPCTEVFFDTGEEFGPQYRPGKHFDDVGRYIEIWNAGVFMELNKASDGSFSPLPLKSVDTGSGLERMAMVMNGLESVYETDLLAPLVDIAKKILLSAPRKLTESDLKRKCRILADHIRASVLILSEGISPGHEGQSYIPRRLLRKCISTFVSSQITEIDFTKLIFKVIEILSPYYSHLIPAKEMILYNVKNEIDEFTPIIRKGIDLIENSLKTHKKEELFSGEEAFELVTTHGLPLEVIIEHLGEQGIQVDLKEFDSCYQEHREKSRVISRSSGADDFSQEDLSKILKDVVKTKFLGYEKLKVSSPLEKIIFQNQEVQKFTENDQTFFFVTEKTPFYGESGGQVGDRGKFNGEKFQGEVLDTLKINGVHLHLAKLTSGSISLGEQIHLEVEEMRRYAIARNHSATHLLHSALHEVIGKHAVQKGSQVRSTGLRFDFQHHQSLKEDELSKIEVLVNAWIIENQEGKVETMNYDRALDAGAMALFGEKYEEDVRVVSFKDTSVELCGGTHVQRTGDIGPFLIISETSVAKGIRRIEAITGWEALKMIQSRNKILKEIQASLKVRPESFLTKIEDMKKQNLVKKKETSKSTNDLKYLKKLETKIKGLPTLVALVQSENIASLKNMGDLLIQKGDYKIISLIMNSEKLSSCVWIQKGEQIMAKDVLAQILLPVNGKGGGKPLFAQGGGEVPENFDNFFESISKNFSENFK